MSMPGFHAKPCSFSCNYTHKQNSEVHNLWHVMQVYANVCCRAAELITWNVKIL